jgi:hypothetical protein
MHSIQLEDDCKCWIVHDVQGEVEAYLNMSRETVEIKKGKNRFKDQDLNLRTSEFEALCWKYYAK